jgi:hypothetical protein
MRKFYIIPQVLGLILTIRVDMFPAVKPGLPSIINMDMSLFSEENLIPGRVIDNVLLEVLKR